MFCVVQKTQLPCQVYQWKKCSTIIKLSYNFSIVLQLCGQVGLSENGVPKILRSTIMFPHSLMAISGELNIKLTNIYIYTYISIYVDTQIHGCKDIQIYRYKYVYIYIYVYTQIGTQIYRYIDIQICRHVDTQISRYLDILIQRCMYIYICMYTDIQYDITI